jgi:predicted enzyme related to lactoylglutathione lyase
MPEPKPAQPQKLLGISPSFIVDDVVKAAEYYRDVLGFSFNRYWGEPPCFVILGRDSVEIFLSSTGVQGLVRPNRKAHPEVVWDAYVRITDVEALRDELAARGAKIIRGPESTFYHTREIEVEDCNGYVLCFSENVPQ